MGSGPLWAPPKPPQPLPLGPPLPPRLMVEAAGLSGARGALLQQGRELWGSPMDCPKAALGPLRGRLQEGKQRLSHRWVQLRALAASNGKLQAQLRPLQAQALEAVRPPPELQGEGQRLLEVLSMLGKRRVPLPPSPAHSPLQPIRRALGMAESEPPQGALLRVAALRGELQQLRGAWPAQGAGPEKPRPPRGEARGGRGQHHAPPPAAGAVQSAPAAHQGLAPPPGCRQPMVGAAGPVDRSRAPRQHPLLPLAEALDPGLPCPGLAPPPPFSPAHQRRGRAGPEQAPPLSLAFTRRSYWMLHRRRGLERGCGLGAEVLAGA
ncbi:thyroid receptor-interacting protein 6-like isoform X1 [Lathamus discolor]|uniref:thyroid receptor-interacting protein 6-like isoform X1 n=1 Tax=Lathamus discolor TaxID=678569 RepID=UPI0032B7C316